MRADPYRAADAGDWNAFISVSRNGTFLHDRSYMEYHAARFSDASLVLRDDDGRIVALLPANRDGVRVLSHQGLTYGGLILGPRTTYAETVAAFDAIRATLVEQGARELIYKAAPHIYHAAPSEEDRCVLAAMGASIARSDPLSVIALANRPKPQERRRRGAAKAAKAGITIRESRDFAGFWRVLEATLRDRHESRPVHSLDEMTLLAARFPQNILLHLAMHGDAILGGSVIYATPTVARSQYIAASSDGLEVGALDLLFLGLLDGAYSSLRYFDFGTSMDPSGGINRGLLDQKEGFGARAVAQDTYRMVL